MKITKMRQNDMSEIIPGGNKDAIVIGCIILESDEAARRSLTTLLFSMNKRLIMARCDVP